jgi:hypothetical protein
LSLNPCSTSSRTVEEAGQAFGAAADSHQTTRPVANA